MDFMDSESLSPTLVLDDTYYLNKLLTAILHSHTLISC